MKIKKYERKDLIIITIISVVMVEIIIFLFLNKIRIKEYNNYQIIALESNKAMVITKIKDKNIWYKNRFIYINGKKVKYDINQITKDREYLKLLLIINIPEKHNENDIITISIENKRTNIIKAIMKTWGGD